MTGKDQAALDAFLESTSAAGWDLDDMTTPVNESNLPAALRRWYFSDGLWPMVNHPLLIEPLPRGPERLAARYAHNRRTFREAVQAQDYGKALWLIAKPYRIDVLWSWWYGGRIREDVVRQILPGAWMAVEHAYSCADKAMELFAAAGYCGDVPNLGPGVYDVYRGADWDEPDPGLSWSLTLSMAQWFAHRWDGHTDAQPVLWMAKVNASDILARFEGRGETEVVIHPDAVQGLQKIYEEVRRGQG